MADAQDSPGAETWVEVADGVLVLRHRPGGLDVSSTAVVGPTGTVVIDALPSPTVAARPYRDLVERTGRPVTALVLTHGHYDHTFGSVVLTHGPAFAHRRDDPAARDAGVTVHAHHRLPAHLRDHEEAELAAGRSGDLVLGDPTLWDDVVLPVPDVLVTSTATIGPGGRDVVLEPWPTAHTTCDLVVHVPDAGVWVVGDVVEESGEPSLETDSDPVGWAAALTDLASRIGPDELVVPGHGAVVDRAFVAEQASVLTDLATTLVRCRGAGLTPHEAVRELRVATGWHAGTLRAAAEAYWATTTTAGPA